MSIELRGVTKSYRVRGRRNVVIDNLDLTIPKGAKVGLLGRNGAGKSTLLRLIGGSEPPDRGRVVRNMSVSWPLGFSGFFLGALSGAANVRFCARIYGIEPDAIIEKVAEFAELGSYMHEPVETYSTGMRARLAFAMSMAIDFDCMLIDEILGVGDARFRKKSQAALDKRRAKSGLVLVSHSPGDIVRNCDKVVVLGFGKPYVSDDVGGVVREYQRYMTHEAPAAAGGQGRAA